MLRLHKPEPLASHIDLDEDEDEREFNGDLETLYHPMESCHVFFLNGDGCVRCECVEGTM